MIKTIKQPKLNIAKLMAIGICLLGPYRASAQNQTNIPLKQEIGPAYMTETVAPVQAPFEMPQLQPPQFPLRSHVVKMNEKGLSTAQIQQAIDKLADKGGGTVIIPQGKWETGRITLKSNINLEIQEGAELQFSGLIADYLPTVFTRDEGIEIYSLGACIYANGAENIAITGKGCIKGPSTDCEIYRLN